MEISSDFSGVLKGMAHNAELIASTMGAMGQNVVFSGFQQASVTNDGKTIAAQYIPRDVAERDGVVRTQDVAKATEREVGDGTSASVVTFSALCHAQPILAVLHGVGRQQFLAGMGQAIDDYVLNVKKAATPVGDDEEGLRLVQHVVKVAMHGDRRAEAIGALVHKTGEHGFLEVRMATDNRFSTDVANGFRYSGTRLIPFQQFFTHEGGAIMHGAQVVVAAQEISSYEQQLKPIFACWDKSRPLVIFATNIKGDALMTCVNAATGAGGQQKYPILLLNVPGESATEQQENLMDIAAYTGATFIHNVGNGRSVRNFNKECFGTAAKVDATPFNVSILPGERTASDTMEFENYIETLSSHIEGESDANTVKVMRTRKSRLLGKVGIIFIAPMTEAEFTHDIQLVNDAYLAGQSAFKKGVVPGGGSIAAKMAMSPCVSKEMEGGYLFAAKALCSPFRAILRNAGASREDAARLGRKLCDSDVPNAVVDARTLEIVDAFEAGILDTAHGIEEVAMNSWSAAKQFINSKYLILND